MIGSSLESPRKREIGNNTVGVRTQQKKRRVPRIDSCRVTSFQGVKANKAASEADQSVAWKLTKKSISGSES